MEEPKKILIIEDNEAVAKLLCRYLEKNGYQVKWVPNGLQGFNETRKIHPDLIILDLLLPDMDGHKVCHMIKSDRVLEKIPVTILTSRDTEEDAELAKKCGADAFVVKTTRLPILLDVIRRLLKKSSENNQ
ncbi:MAG: response regulator [bacterium]